MPEMPHNAYHLDIPLQADPQYHFHISATDELNAQLSNIGSSLLRFAASLARTDTTRPPHLNDLVDRAHIERAAELLFGSALAHQLAGPEIAGRAGSESSNPPPRERRSRPVFISYASEDGAAFAKRLIVNLKRHGLGCFFAERSIPTASDWRNEIWEAMARCKVVVPILTARFSESHWCTGEVGAALSHKRTVVAVLRPGGAIPQTIERLQVMKVEKPAEMRKLVQILKSICARPATDN